ncbi:MAG: filamentous hemagglutinin N-terminal domain-containing protein [Vampirovibrionales bacterium]|nr:filamentous hemagglutinin N-terminal domain-containing protein [Vampirovibrionales bacterium]
MKSPAFLKNAFQGLAPQAIRRAATGVTLALALLGLSASAGGWAIATEPRVASGDVRVTHGENVWNIEIRSAQAILEWRSFDVAAGETVNFILPNANASVLNRVLDASKPASIQGAVNANGVMVLVSRAGVVLEPSATLQASGCVVSWHGLSNAAFLSHRWVFSHPLDVGSGSVRNRGVIQAFQKGQVDLIADDIDNTGIVFSPSGRVRASSGKTVYGLSDSPEIAANLPFAIEPHSIEAGDTRLRISNAGVVNAPYVAISGVIRAEAENHASTEPMLVTIPMQDDRVSSQPKGDSLDTITLPLIEAP